MPKNKLGLFSAVFLSIASIIGSGWLFAPYRAAETAGPASIFSWIIGAFIIILLGLCFSEIAGLYPRRGLSAIIPTLSHNKHFAFPFSIINWLGTVAVVALEADATIQYLINLFPSVQSAVFNNNQLTMLGKECALGLVVLFSLINYWGAVTLAKTNNIFTLIKITIPVTISLVVITVAFHPSNFTYVNHSIAPYGVRSIFDAILTTGIVIAFNGFQTLISFSSEIKRFYRTIPLAVFLSIVICLVVYLLLQIAFIGGITPSLLHAGGWGSLNFHAPFIQLMGLISLTMLTPVIYFGATIGPCGSGIAFTGSASRMFTAMARNQHMPKFFDRVHPVYSISRRSLIFNMLLSAVFLFAFPSWGKMAEMLSLLHIVSYLPVPIALWILRGKISKEKYLFRIPFGKSIAFFVFLFFTYLFTLSSLHIVLKLVGVLAVFQVVFILSNVKSFPHFKNIMQQTFPLVIYFAGLVVLTRLSPNNSHLLSETSFLATVVAFSIFLFALLLKFERNDVEIIDSSVNIFRQRPQSVTVR